MKQHKFIISIALGALLTVGLLMALVLHAAPAQAQRVLAPENPTIDNSDAISQALTYVRTQQQPDGGIDAFGMGYGSNEGGTVLTTLALAAAGHPMSWMTHITTGKTTVDYLAAHAIGYTHQTTHTTSAYLFPQQAGHLLAAVAGANEDPTNFGGMDLIAQLNDTYQPATGAYSTTAREGFYTGEAEDDNQAMAILGLVAAGQQVPVTATNYLIDQQAADGSWGLGDPDTTAQAVMALIGSGNVEPTDAAIQKALGFFHDTQLPSGGWRPWWDTDPANADSTGWVIQALVAAGYTPATESWAHLHNTPHTALLDLQKPDGRIGGIYANAYSTSEAVFGLTEQPLFFLGREHRALRALTWMGALQDVDGAWPTPFGHPAGPTCDAVLAYAAAGYDPYTVKAPGSVTSAMDYLSNTAISFVSLDPSSAGKLAIAVEAAGGDADNFGGVNIVHVLTSTWYSPTTGAFGDAANSWYQAFGVMGLAAAGETIPISATQTILDLQNPDGSWVDAWGFDRPGSTGLALQALVAAGVPMTDTSIVSGTQALRNEQNTQGSWSAFGSPSVNSTALAMQGLLAAGEDLTDMKWWKGGHSPYDALADLQKSDGPFTFMLGDDFFSTRQAVPAQLGVHYPFSHPLKPFAPVNRGPDPDRLVAAPPRVVSGNSLDVVVPFGSDADINGEVILNWRIKGGDWETPTLHKAEGYYTATIEVAPSAGYELQALFTDVEDGVQYENTVTTDTVTLQPEADMRVTKTHIPDPVAPGERLTYVLTALNAGPSEAQRVLVTDTLPVEVFSPPMATLVLPTPPGTVYVPGTASMPAKVWWDLGTLAPGATEILTVVVEVQDWVTKTFTNTVVVTANTYDPYLENNTYKDPTIVADRVYLPLILKSP